MFNFFKKFYSKFFLLISSSVFLIPSSRDIFGLHPKVFIFFVLSCFLGVPSGLDLSHKISEGN